MNAQARRWCDGLPDVTAEMDCGGQPHRILWRRGKLVLPDHDVLAERTLVALGCEPPLCVEVLDAWLGLRGPELLHEFLMRGRTVAVEELASRKAAHVEAVTRARGLMSGPAQVLRGLLSNAEQQIEREKHAWAMTLLEALPIEFRRMLVLSMIVEMQRRWHDDPYRAAHRRHVEPVLQATVGRLVERSARRWEEGALGRYARLEIEVRVLAPGEAPECAVQFEADGGDGLVSLALSWFTDVWSRGLALVDECFVIARDGPAAGPGTVPVVAVRWERDRRHVCMGVPAPAVVTYGDDETWSLRWL